MTKNIATKIKQKISIQNIDVNDVFMFVHKKSKEFVYEQSISIRYNALMYTISFL